MIAPIVEPRAIVVEALTVALVIVHDVEMVLVDLEAPYRHGVVDAEIPRRLHRQIGVDRHVADAALLFGEQNLFSPVGTEDRRLERAVIFLVD